MKKSLLVAITLFILLTTISSKQKIIFSKFNVKQVNIENNFLLKKEEITNLLTPIFNKNIIFLKSSEIEKLLTQNNLIESFNIKKKYPSSLKIRIYEKKPIAILFDKKKKYYLSDKIELIEFNNFIIFNNLPHVIGNKNEFKIFYNNLVKINFPFNKIKKYTLFESNRWDLETLDNNIIKLPPQNYTRSLENYLKIKNRKDFEKYKVFDFRISNQLILK